MAIMGLLFCSKTIEQLKTKQVVGKLIIFMKYLQMLYVADANYKYFAWAGTPTRTIFIASFHCTRLLIFCLLPVRNRMFSCIYLHRTHSTRCRDIFLSIVGQILQEVLLLSQTLVSDSCQTVLYSALLLCIFILLEIPLFGCV